MRLKLSLKFLLSTSCLMAMIEIAWADVLPGSAMPDTVGKYLQKKAQSNVEVLPPVVANTAPDTSPGVDNAKKINLILKKVILTGNHVYSTQELEKIYQSQLNKVITVADLFKITQAITNYYRNNGYIISRALLPPQHVKEGVVQINIIEGFIDKVDVTGQPKWSKCLLLGMAEQIKACKPLQISRMEHYLMVANEVPGVQTRAVLSPSKTKLGAADLNLNTQMKTVTGYLSYDNYGSRYIGPQQMTANLGFNSFAFSGDTLQLTSSKTPQGFELTFYDANYSFPFDDYGDRMSFGISEIVTHPAFILYATKIEGINKNYYASFSIPIIRERSSNLSLQFSFNYLDSSVTALDELPLYSDHLRNLGVNMSYNFADRFNGSNSFGLEMRQGLPIFGNTTQYDPATAETSRPGGRSDYTKFTTQFNHQQPIKWGLSFYTTLRAQFAHAPLLASEQFTFGGNQLGRGYDLAELIGDKGLAGGLELRYDVSLGRFLPDLQLYAFYDAAQIWSNLRVAGTAPQQSATSVGLGTRFTLTQSLSGNLFWAQPLTRYVAAEDQIGRGWRPRVFFSIVFSL